jgi:hypothetical protein
VTLPDFHAAVAPGQRPIITDLMRDVSPNVLEQLRFWLEMNPPAIPITQFPGFTQFQSQYAYLFPAVQSTTSSAFVDLATPGPSLSGLPTGQYVISHGCASYINVVGGGREARQGLSINGSTPIDNDTCIQEGNNFASLAITVQKTLANASNTITCKYASQDNVTQAFFARRWLMALKFANA